MDTITTPNALQQALQLADPVDAQAAHTFPVRVPADFLARIRAGTTDDPLLRQVLPTRAEDEEVPGFVDDPVGDHDAQKVPGLLHKYYGRVLLTVTGACAIHCRYCFRRAFSCMELRAGTPEWQAVRDYVAADPSITEVILSGGDPLVLSTPKLSCLINDLLAIPHLQRLRIHSRVPIAQPTRINAAFLTLCATLAASRLRTTLVVHANHPDEIDATVADTLTQLWRTGITLLNQSVLLHGVNDNASVLATLSERLFAAHVLPYYLHQLDPARGTAHFQVKLSTASGIMAQLRSQLPGYLVPRWVCEQAGQPAKTPIG